MSVAQRCKRLTSAGPGRFGKGRCRKWARSVFPSCANSNVKPCVCVVRLDRTSRSWDNDHAAHSARRPRRSAGPAVRLSLKWGRLEWLWSRMKWFETGASIDTNFCGLRIRRKRIITRSRRRNGPFSRFSRKSLSGNGCEFPARLMSQRPVSCRASAPFSLREAP